MTIVLLVIGLILGCLLCLPKIKKTNRINEEIEKQNKEIAKKNQQLKATSASLAKQQQEEMEYLQKIEKDKSVLVAELAQLKERIAENDKSADEIIALVNEKLDRAKEEAKGHYKDAEHDYRTEYEKVMMESTKELEIILDEKMRQIDDISSQLQAWKAKQTAILEAQKAEEDKKLNADKYRVIISSADRMEISHLREIIPFFRNPRAINKCIWESYFRTPLKELSDRVMSEDGSGIYKLTDLTSGQVYVGQSVNVKKRFAEHAKKSLGLEGVPNNKLYKAMSASGLENFTFELLEECPKAQLNDREKFYIDYYQSVEYGLNEKAGGARV